MSIFETYLAGLVVAHFLWFFFFTTGQLLRPRIDGEGETSASMAQFVITSVAGMAVSGFGLLFLGFAHLLNPFGIATALLVEGVLFWLLKGDNWLSWIFWRVTFERFIGPWEFPALFVYFVFLVLGVPAVLPPSFADSVTYHLAYAVDWANAGRIGVDPFLRFPYYANNFLLLHSALFVLKLGNYCHFLTWLCGLLTCLGIQAFFCPAEKPSRPRDSSRQFHAHRFLIPLCVALSPVFLRYLNVGYVDVPIGLFLLVPVLCAYRTATHQSFEREFVVTGAFCAGMKLTLIAHLPFFLVTLIFAAFARRLRAREITVLALILVGLSLPWYVRNVIAAHDPVPPILNFYFNRPDPIFTRADAAIYTGDTMTGRKPLSLLSLPFRFFTDPESNDFREPGVSALILLLDAPILFLIGWLCCRVWRPPGRLIYLSVTAVYLTSPWFFSSLGRYSLHWYPILAAWIGVVISHICARVEAAWDSRLSQWTTSLVSAAFCCALICPAPTQASMRFFRDCYVAMPALARPRRDLRIYLERTLISYPASEAVVETLAFNQRKNSRVLGLRAEYLAFYFRRARIISVGDYFGPARYGDLFDGVKKGNCLPYLNRLDIAAVIVDPSASRGWSGFYKKFRTQLKKGGFVEYRYRNDQVPIFLRSDIRPAHKLTQAIQ